MDKVTQRGVYKDINDSHYKVNLDGVTFWFLSNSSLSKFVDIFIEERKKNFISTLKNKKELNVQFYNLSTDLSTYMKCEKRVFKVSIKGVDYLCPNEIPQSILITT